MEEITYLPPEMHNFQNEQAIFYYYQGMVLLKLLAFFTFLHFNLLRKNDQKFLTFQNFEAKQS